MHPCLARSSASPRRRPPCAAAGIAAFLVGMLAAKSRIAEARGLEKIVALTGVGVAVPLAVFGALHLFGPRFVMSLVPAYMPWRMFWVYAVGCALIAASVSIATGTGVRWSGLLFGMMMFLFVAMITSPIRCCSPASSSRSRARFPPRNSQEVHILRLK